MSAIDDLINDARNYAITVTSNAAAAMTGAQNAIDSIGRGSVSSGGSTPNVDVEPPSPYDPGDVPAYKGKRWSAKTFTKSEPTLQFVGDLTLPQEPGNAPEPRDFKEPNKPAGEADKSLLASPPTIRSNITSPTAPDLNIDGILEPELEPIDLPDTPTYHPPSFTGTRVSFNETAPTGDQLKALMRSETLDMAPIFRTALKTELDNFLDSEFPNFRAGMAAIEERLSTYLAGGTALTPAVEDAIYNRTLDKTNKEAIKAKDEAWRKAARAGFTMPSAMLLAQQIDVDQAGRDNNARAATEIAIKQAELEQQNLQFAVTQSANLRQVAMNAAMSYYGGLVQINAQAIEYARAVVDAVVKAYDIATRYAEVQVRIYEADMRRYEMDLKAALAIYDVYDAQIKGELAKAEVNKANLEVYKTRIEAVLAEANVFRAQIDAVRGEIELEKLKIDLYRARVDTYVAQVNGYSAQWSGYQAAVQGEMTAVQASTEKIRAYTAKTQAFETIVRARTAAIEAKAKSNDQKMMVYKTQVDAYNALINAEARAVEADIASYDETIKAYVAEANAMSAKSQSEVQLYKIAHEGLVSAARLQFDYVRERNAMDVARAEAAGRVGAVIGDIYARTAQATLAGLNTLAAKSESISS